MGRIADALHDYDQAIALEPGVADYYVNRGAMRIAAKRYEDAIRDYDRVIALIEALKAMVARQRRQAASRN